MPPLPGKLIALEGIDGSGKSTLATSLHAFLLKNHIPAILTKEPGGTPLGITTRKLLQDRPVSICARAEFLLFAADRAQHFEEKVIPALRQGTVVISDRMADSALVYQGYGRGLDRTMITTINRWAMQGMTPDLTIYVRIDVATAHQRIAQRAGARSVFDAEKEDFFKRLVAGYDELYQNRSDILIVDGTLAPDTLSDTTSQRILTWMRS